METIIEYLKNPIKIGVYNYKAIIDLTVVGDYLKKQAEEYKEKKSSLPRSLVERIASRLAESIEHLDPSEPDGFLDNLTNALEIFAGFPNCPKELKEVFYHETSQPSRVARRPFRRRKRPNIFGSHTVQEVKDVVFVDRTLVDTAKWLFDVISIKESGLSEFKNTLQCVPTVSERLKCVKERRQFSQRYVLRPYSLAVQLWLQDDSSIGVPLDLKSFLRGAIRYFSSEEWRTSIVLSAIATESMLADMYEETFKELAPDTPLGDLFYKVKTDVNFPAEIIRAIEMTNEARIAAVHRSRFPVSDREATNALFGATNFALWYSSKF